MPTKVTYNEPVKEKVKVLSKLVFNLNFTSTKVLAYIVTIMGFVLSLILKSESPFVMAVGASTVLMGVKAVSDNNVLVKNGTPANEPPA